MKKPSMHGESPRIGVYVCHCGLNISRTVDCPKVASESAVLENVVLGRDIQYACSEPGQQSITEDIAEHTLDRIVIASCSPRLHEPTFRQMLERAGLNPYMLEMANLREQCSWVHINEPDAATSKASPGENGCGQGRPAGTAQQPESSNQQTNFGNRGRHRRNSNGARPCR